MYRKLRRFTFLLAIVTRVSLETFWTPSTRNGWMKYHYPYWRLIAWTSRRDRRPRCRVDKADERLLELKYPTQKVWSRSRHEPRELSILQGYFLVSVPILSDNCNTCTCSAWTDLSDCSLSTDTDQTFEECLAFEGVLLIFLQKSWIGGVLWGPSSQQLEFIVVVVIEESSIVDNFFF